MRVCGKCGTKENVIVTTVRNEVEWLCESCMDEIFELEEKEMMEEGFCDKN